jgi:glycosyltransferase involved in cell wall biosynthesis
MTITAFSYVRNGIQMGYPFLESIQSVLPNVDEFVVVVGDSTDGTVEAIENLGSEKIRIVNSVWDMSLKSGGKLFAIQSNIGLDNMNGDWVIHIQADEVIHENDCAKLKDYIVRYSRHQDVEGLLFPFLNFHGDFNHIHTGRKAHRFEIRAFRRNSLIRAFKDSQGFRKFSSHVAYEMGELGEKLRVKKIDVPVYHYNFVRSPQLMKDKTIFFQQFWHEGEALKDKVSKLKDFDFNQIDKLEVFQGSHPQLMQKIISKQDWNFVYDPSKSKVSLRHRILNEIEEWTGYRIGEYKNYKII